MTIKELAYSAQQHLQAEVGISVKRAHVYELLAACFGFKSFAAFDAVALLSDAGVGSSLPTASPQLIGRSVQLGYAQARATMIATELVRFALRRSISFVEKRELFSIVLPPAPEWADDEEFDDADLDFDGEERIQDERGATAPKLSELRVSNLLVNGLERMAGGNDPRAHFALAALHRCELPNSYLYEESLKGRVLSKVEQRWADEYVQKKPQFEKYKHHLHEAAIGGVRDAALEFAGAFGERAFYALAETGAGPVNARRMAEVAASLDDFEAENRWLRVAAEERSSPALFRLAGRGDVWAVRRLAESGDIDAIRDLAARSSTADLKEAWKWMHLARLLGTDLSHSTLRAYHDGGLYDGQAYDDDQGGALYVAGDEGLELAPLSKPEDRIARRLARAMFNRIRD